ncbi:MAG: type IV pilus assembly protein PilM [Candidatus Andersenbacteria bacterium]
MIGIDISDRSIKVVEISGGENPKLRTVCWSALNPNLIRRGIVQDVAAVMQGLEQALNKCSPVPVEGKRVVLSIPETQSFVRVLDLPAMSEREMNEAVQWAIRQHIPFDLERVYLDWQPLATSQTTPTHRQVLVGAAQRDVIDPLLQVVDALGLEVAALELEAQAIVRCLLPQNAADVMGVLLVDLGATSTNVIFVDEGAMRFTTSIQQGGDDLTQQLAQEFKLQPTIAAEKKALIGVQTNGNEAQIAATLRSATLRLVQQVSQVVTEYTSQLQSSQGLRAILLAGGAANLPGLVSIFAEVFPGIPVQLGNPWINLTMGNGKETSPPLSNADAAHFTTAIGLALRSLEYAPR